MKSKLHFTTVLILLLAACGTSKKMTTLRTYPQIPLLENKPADSKLLTDLLAQNAEKLGTVVNNKDSFRLQIVFTQIDRDEKMHRILPIIFTMLTTSIFTRQAL